jgi:DNA-binding transcriptional ArsR family regulator
MARTETLLFMDRNIIAAAGTVLTNDPHRVIFNYMVEYSLALNLDLDLVFGSLSDPTRRDILRQASRREMSVGEIAKSYDLTFAAVSKHLKVLEQARLISKRKRGREQLVRITPQTLADADDYLKQYQALWDRRLDALEELLKKGV